MEVKDILAAAKKAVEEAGIPDDLKLTAFGKAIDLYSSSVTLLRTESQNTDIGSPQAPSGHESDESLMDRIAKHLKLDRTIIDEVYYEEDGEVRLSVSKSKIESSKSAGTKQLAVLISAGRQASGLEEVTSFEVIRQVAEDYNRLDSTNFAKAVDAMGHIFSFRGQGKSRSVKLGRPGFEEASKYVIKVGGGEP